MPDKEEYMKRLAVGKCSQCYHRPLIPGLTYCPHCKERARNKGRALKKEVLAAYGSRCLCCGEKRWQFLSIDHGWGNGSEERRRLFGSNGYGVGQKFYRHLQKEGYPQDRGYRVLCTNCNSAVGMYGQCPHDEERERRGNPRILGPNPDVEVVTPNGPVVVAEVTDG